VVEWSRSLNLSDQSNGTHIMGRILVWGSREYTYLISIIITKKKQVKKDLGRMERKKGGTEGRGGRRGKKIIHLKWNPLPRINVETDTITKRRWPGVSTVVLALMPKEKRKRTTKNNRITKM
jgi:hypothetical protein